MKARMARELMRAILARRPISTPKKSSRDCCTALVQEETESRALKLIRPVDSEAAQDAYL